MPSVLLISRAVQAQSPEVAADSDQTLYADFSISAVAAGPWGLWSDGTTLWVGQDTSPNAKNPRLSPEGRHHHQRRRVRDPRRGTRTSQMSPSDRGARCLDRGRGLPLRLRDSPQRQGACLTRVRPGVLAWNRADRTRAQSRDFAYRGASHRHRCWRNRPLLWQRGLRGSHLSERLDERTLMRSTWWTTPIPPPTSTAPRTPSAKITHCPSLALRGLHREGDILWVTGPERQTRSMPSDMSDGARQGYLEFDLRSQDHETRTASGPTA